MAGQRLSLGKPTLQLALSLSSPWACFGSVYWRPGSCCEAILLPTLPLGHHSAQVKLNVNTSLGISSTSADCLISCLLSAFYLACSVSCLPSKERLPSCKDRCHIQYRITHVGWMLYKNLISLTFLGMAWSSLPSFPDFDALASPLCTVAMPAFPSALPSGPEKSP